ncbi:DUF2946 family protein [Pseudomonas sp. PDM14]|uniref:DUF2946 family protein n=1 Tax=Pseudomonas sp. PDM14 TaxID=2769288 RepID=UPI00178393DD|nr:DUF2946 family protein [Pseudomonas sp. PDM14]MBD9482536.1 DUF2946 family protein [Pseudomonas sp. PDM14]
MNLTRDRRSLTAWVLYASVLFSLFACGIHHGQMSGLQLSGLNGGFCSMGSDSGPGIDLGSSQQTPDAAEFSCPLCSSSSLAVAVHSATWAFDPAHLHGVPAVSAGDWVHPPPHHLWPSLNPRASPALLV